MATLCKWVAGLSNGETVIEDMGQFAEVKGGVSSWQLLQQYLRDNKLEINSLKIRVYEQSLLKKTVRDYNLPSNKSRFASDAPLDLECSTLVRKLFIKKSADDPMFELNDKEERYIVATAYYSFGKISIIISRKDTNQSWISVKLSK